MMERKKRTLSTLLSTTYQTIYSTPSNFDCDISSILIVNQTAAIRSVTIELYSATTGTFTKVAGELPLGVNGIVVLDNVLSLKVGDYLRALASANTAVTVHVVADEKYFPKR